MKKNYSTPKVTVFLKSLTIPASLFLLMVAFTFGACKKNELTEMEQTAHMLGTINNDADFIRHYTGLGSQTLWELQQARAATARYRNIQNAIKDGYTDINVIVENMGHHFMKSSLVNETFDMRKPEILVYNKHEDGTYDLVAVEYAVPLTASVNAPEGFTGNADVWDRNTNFGLWLLHAWVWHYNPDGVFNPTNPLVHQH